MSVTDTMKAAFQSIAAGLSAASQAAVAADATAENIGQNAAGNGFTGIMQSLGRVRQLIQEARSHLGAAAATAADTQTVVNSIPQQLSPDQTVTVLAPLIERITAVDAGINGAAELTQQAKQAAAAALRGGSPEEMLARLDRIISVLTAIRQQSAAAREQVQQAILAARQTGKSAGN